MESTAASGFVREPWGQGQMPSSGRISPQDLHLFHLTDDPDEAVEVIVDARELLFERAAEHAGDGR